MKEKLGIASYKNFNELLNQRAEILNACRHKWGFGFFYAIFILSGDHINYKMSFFPTLFSQNYTIVLLGKPWVGNFKLF